MSKWTSDPDEQRKRIYQALVIADADSNDFETPTEVMRARSGWD